jgi:hypothetical protein
LETPEAPVVGIVMVVIGAFIQEVGLEDGAPAVLAGVTVIVPIALRLPQPPVKGMEYAKLPLAVGVPAIVIVLPDQLALTPAGNPFAPETPLFDIPVAPLVVCVTFVSRGVLIHNVGEDDAALTPLTGEIVKVPTAFTIPQPPVNGIIYPKTPELVGVPLKVIVFPDQLALTPGGKPFAPVTPSSEIPFAPVVESVIADKETLIQELAVEEGAPTVLFGVTVIVPVAFTLPQPPVNGIE